MVKIRLSRKFDFIYKELIFLEPDQKSTVWDKVNIFRKNPLDTRLNNHLLKGKLNDKWAFSVTDDIGIVYEWKTKNVVRFLAIGRHEKVYGRKSKN
jgi:mRNA-degrading endonuclease YafQ of YafQ-DinJ toxin-antitoxin module